MLESREGGVHRQQEPREAVQGGERSGSVLAGRPEARSPTGSSASSPAGGSAAESEVWVDRKDLEQQHRPRGDTSPASSSAPRDRRRIAPDQEDPRNRHPVQARRDPRGRSISPPSPVRASFLKVAGTVIAVLLTIGAMFAAANTMYAAVRSRTREIGTMRALGFSRGPTSSFPSWASPSSSAHSAASSACWPRSPLRLHHGQHQRQLRRRFAEVSANFRFGPLVMGGRPRS